MAERTIVVGGGAGGLAAAAYAAKAGSSVLVLERAGHLGGRAATHEEGGFSMNLGAHALYLHGHAEAALRELNVKYTGNRPKSVGFSSYEGRLHTLPAGPLTLLTTGLFGAGDKLAVGKLLAELGRIDPAAYDGETVRAWIDRKIASPRARAFLESVVRVSTYTNAPNRLSAGLAIRQIAHVNAHGVKYLDGGWHTLVDGLVKSAKTIGAEIRCDVKIARVCVERNRATGVELSDGEVLRADRVVLAVGPDACARLLPEDRAIARAAKEAVPVEAACLDVALSKLPRPGASLLLGADEPTYASVHSATAKLAPDGCALVHVVRYLAEGERTTYESLSNALELLQPGFRDGLVRERFLPKMTVMHARVDADRGGLAGRISAPDTEAVSLVGDWVGPRGILLDCVLASARAAFVREERAAA